MNATNVFSPILQCPICHDNLIKDNEYSVHCSCHTYPVIRGIVYLRNIPSEKKKAVFSCLAHGDEKQALLLLLDSRKIAKYLVTYAPRLPLSLILFFLSVFYPSGEAWWGYLAKRKKRITHMLSLMTITDIHHGDVVADICCGPGHFLRQIGLWKKPKLMIGCDGSLFLLCLARQYLVTPETILVCADIEHGLPIRDASVHDVFMNDAFMYIRQKKHIISEIRRSITNNGVVFLTHVHGKYVENPGQGMGINPSSVRQLAQDLFTVGMVTDRQLAAAVTKTKNVRYVSHTEVGFPSYSYQFVPKQKSLHELTLDINLRSYVAETHIDYTEDEWMRINP